MPGGVAFNTSICNDSDAFCMFELLVHQGLSSAKLKIFDEASRGSICDSHSLTHQTGQECESSLPKDISRGQQLKKPSVDWIDSESSNPKAKRKMTELFGNELIEVGQEFDNVKCFRDALHNYTIA